MKLDKRIKIYTSYYSKMCSRLKDDNDIYIQISNSLFCPKISKSGLSIEQEIDFNWGAYLGALNYTFTQYYNEVLSRDLIKDTLFYFIKNVCLQELKENETVNIFLLCHENLEKKYTKNSRAVKEGLNTVNDYEQCHRRILADFIENEFNLFIPEYDIKKENESIVYRKYLNYTSQ